MKLSRSHIAVRANCRRLLRARLTRYGKSQEYACEHAYGDEFTALIDAALLGSATLEHVYMLTNDYAGRFDKDIAEMMVQVRAYTAQHDLFDR